MERFDLVVIGAGTAGEAATHYARAQGASVAVVDRDLFGGSCPFWACMPSKALLHAAAIHHAGGDYPWERASAFRDYMINRENRDRPDDSGHVSALEGAGATVIRGSAALAGPNQVRVGDRLLTTDNVLLAVGSVSRVPHDLPGLEEAQAWTNVQGTGTRELPRSLVILGGGPTGVELAQVYARYGVQVTLVHPRDRVHDKEHRRSSDLLGAALEAEGVRLRLNARAVRVQAAPRGGQHRVELDNGETAEGHEIMLAIGRDLPLGGLGLDTIGVVPSNGRLAPDERLRIAEGVYVAGDVAGPELHTHLGHYTGEAAARIALGDADYRPFLDAIPRATYTTPETASVGLLLDQAKKRGLDAQEFTVDLATTAKGYTTESQGHVTIVVDRSERVLVGAFMAGPGGSEAIHECVLAIRARVPLATLADTIHAFPTVARVLGTAFINADRELPSVTEFLATTTDLLRRTPEVLHALLAGLPEDWTDTTDAAENGWRPRDVIGHLITGELTDWIERTQRILEHGTSLPFDRFDRFAHADRDTDATLDELVEHFARLRAENLARLRDLATEGDLDRRGMHPSLGEVTLRELLATWAVHDLDHVSQIFAGVAGSHDAEVGPWKAYLGILLRRDDPSAVAG